MQAVEGPPLTRRAYRTQVATAYATALAARPPAVLPRPRDEPGAAPAWASAARRRASLRPTSPPAPRSGRHTAG